MDRIFFALSDHSRRSMVEQLSKKEASVSELAKPFKMSMAAIVQHIQILEERNLDRLGEFLERTENERKKKS